MPIEILMPALSPTMTEGNLVKWLKKEGDKVKSGDILAEIETDKATMEMESADDGVMGKILIPAGTEGVKVNAVVALLLNEGEDAGVLAQVTPQGNSSSAEAASSVPSKEAVAPTSSLVKTEIQESSRSFASPLARRIAAQHHVDLKTLQGSGPHGRIVEADVRQAMAEPAKGQQTLQAPLPSFGEGPYQEFPLNTMRKVIARRLTESKQTMPHFYLTVECQLDKVLRLRSDINHSFEDQKLSVNDFIVRACALALIKVPQANVAWYDTHLRQYAHADVAVAVAIENGLVTPIVWRAETKSLREISVKVRDLAERARAGKLKPEEYQGGTFTLSNLGMFGIKTFSAILNPPQACILAVGAGEKRAVVKEDGSVGVATVMTCTLSVDHRAVDGATGAKFLQAFKDYLENPLRLIV